MENCNFYSHQLDFDAIGRVIQQKLPKAKIEINDGGTQKQLTATLKGGFFSKSKVLKISYRERAQPSYNLKNVNCPVSQNLAGMVNFIQSFPADNPNVKNQLLYKVMSCNSEIAFMAEPRLDEDFQSILLALTQKLDAIVFAQPNSLFTKAQSSHFTDKDLNLILDQEGRSAISNLDVTVDAKYHDSPQDQVAAGQIERKEKSNKILSSKGVQINNHLPCIPSIEATHLRTKKEVCQRIYALMVLAVKGEGLEQDKINATIKAKDIDGFSPRERSIIDKANLDDGDRAYATWRYESLATLLWAVGILQELPYPMTLCDVPQTVGVIMNKSRADFENQVLLRSAKDILDKLDLTYRMNWACVNARIKGTEVGGNLNPSVIYERHYLLNWLTNHENQEWDDVQTTT